MGQSVFNIPARPSHVHGLRSRALSASNQTVRDLSFTRERSCRPEDHNWLDQEAVLGDENWIGTRPVGTHTDTFGLICTSNEDTR